MEVIYLTIKETRDYIISKNRNITFLLTDSNGCEADIKERCVYLSRYWYENPDTSFLFVLLHEIGHIKTNKPLELRSMKEFKATKWALKNRKKYSVRKPSKKTMSIYQNDVFKWYNIETILGEKHALSKTDLMFEEV